MAHELRLYINGHKEFCDFDVDVFIETIRENKGGWELANAFLNEAFKKATGGKTNIGEEFSYAKLEITF